MKKVYNILNEYKNIFITSSIALLVLIVLLVFLDTSSAYDNSVVTIDNLSITNPSVKKEDNLFIFTANVENTLDEEYNLKYIEVTFDNIKSYAYIGDRINPKESKTITLYLNNDISSSKEILYKIIK